MVLLDGEPTWGFLYRRMMPILARAHRVITTDLFGFGRSEHFLQEDRGEAIAERITAWLSG
ncbi:MAG TPA: hypothetical protein VEO00_02870 [Actinomycetota bacterium]|nr:hypothetical protein [Actinomycetota bacterium]